MTKISTRSTRYDAERRYDQLCRQVFEATEEKFRQDLGIDVQLDTIDDAAIVEADRWPEQVEPERIARWSWGKVVAHYRRRARRLEVAFYLVNEDESLTLWGLLVGRFSKSRVVASIHFLARGPIVATVPFTVAAVIYLQQHAAALGCTTISINKPIQELVQYYMDLGFTRVIVKQGRIDRLEADRDRIVVYVTDEAEEGDDESSIYQPT
ncbi:hypothetical protein LGN07_21270 [Burkholderia cepacia]|uniref:hypothetical protein n=1 Tax=Burkholderia cepacia TaxID=292 RepID=UPI001CF171F5|nr:hypothetical protein [Burkholderia cepacia]MCA8121256.1 hypothetical protein [Burkholderia cepacia]